MIKLVTAEEAKREAAKGLKEAIAVSIKKFEYFLSFTFKDIMAWDTYNKDGGADTCGLCQRYCEDCVDCILAKADSACPDFYSQYDLWNDSVYDMRDGEVTTITQFRKETRKMIKILKKLYKENE